MSDSKDKSSTDQSVWLVNSKGDYTIHDRIGRSKVTFNPEFGLPSEAHSLDFRCRETGVVRRYGIDAIASFRSSESDGGS